MAGQGNTVSGRNKALDAKMESPTAGESR